MDSDLRDDDIGVHAADERFVRCICQADVEPNRLLKVENRLLLTWLVPLVETGVPSGTKLMVISSG